MNHDSIQVGSKVRIVSYDELDKIKDRSPTIIPPMFKYANKICTIAGKTTTDFWRIEEDNKGFLWPTAAFRKIKSDNKKQFLKLIL